MANPYFNAAYYLQTNPDVLAGGFTLETAEDHYLQYGANEAYYSANEDIGGTLARKPAPWFDIKHYFTQNPDLIPGGVTPETAFEHFTTYGMYEGRTPNAEAAPLTAENLGEYAAENEDLQEAFGIDDTDNLTEEQQNALAQHYYQYGYDEDRPGTPGNTYTLTADADKGAAFTGTDGDDVFNADADEEGNATLNTVDVLKGGGGDNVLNIGVGGLDNGAMPTLNNIQTIINSDIGIIAESDDGTGTRVDKTLDLSNAEGVEEVWSDFSNLEQSGNLINGVVGNPAMNANVIYNNAAAGTVFGISNVAAQVGRVSSDNNGVGLTGKAGVGVTFRADVDATFNLALADNAEGSYYSAGGGGTHAKYNIDVAEGNSGTLLLSAAVESVVVSGAGDLAIQDESYGVLTSFDASAATGNIRLGDEDRTANDLSLNLAETAVIKGGSGDDEFNLAGVTTNDGTVNAGAGDDVIVIEVQDSAKWTLTGGEGEDIFVVAGSWSNEARAVVTITDFNGADDTLVLGLTDAEDDEDDEDVVIAFAKQSDVDAIVGDTESADEALAAVIEQFGNGFGDGAGGSANVAQFEFAGNTYVVYEGEDVGIGSITLAGVDLDLSADNVMGV